MAKARELQTIKSFAALSHRVLAGIVVLTLCIAPGLVRDASATVDGPTLIEEVRYDEDANRVLYSVQHYDAMGEFFVREYDPETGEFSRLGLDPNELSEFDPLPRIDLEANDIQIEVALPDSYRSDYTHQSYYNWLPIPFSATISQGGEEKAEVEFVGCSGDQEMVFEGFRVPDTDQLLVRLSTVSDCVEHGYVEEQMVPVRDVEIRDPTPIPHRDQHPVMGDPIETEGSVALNPELDDEAIAEHFLEVATQAHDDGDTEIAERYLTAILGHRGHPPARYERAAIRADAGNGDAALEDIETLLNALNRETAEEYVERIAEDDRFSALRERERFRSMMKQYGGEEPSQGEDSE